MKKLLIKLTLTLTFLMSLVSCETTTTTTYYEPQWWYDCYGVYDSYGYYLYDECDWYYYNDDGSVGSELDIAATVADKEKLILEKTAEMYQEKFSLSAEKATQLAKNVTDFSALTDRSESDVADFAQKLYGVNPSEVISAVGNAQVGNNAELDALIDKAASNFETSKDTMKDIVKELHGKALEASGIEL